MHYTQNVVDFVRFNHSEVTRLVISICTTFNFVSHADDVIQNLYAKLLTKKTLERFNPNFNGGTKISTYLHSIIVNMVKAMRSEKENKIESRRYKFQYLNSLKRQYREDPCYDEIERLIHTEGMNVDYEGNLYSNYLTEPVDGINYDLNLFEGYLKRMNRSFKLIRRRCKNVRPKELSLLDVFQHMRKGYNHQAIASKYGVSVTFITSLKTEIKLLMIKYGFIYGTPRQQKIYSALKK